jgi:hypothetical protein
VITHNQTVRLLAFAAAYDQRTTGEYDIQAWQMASGPGRWSYEAVQRVIAEHYAADASRPRLTPAMVTDRLRSVRAQAAETFELPRIPEELPDAEYPPVRLLRRQDHRLADRIVRRCPASSRALRRALRRIARRAARQAALGDGDRQRPRRRPDDLLARAARPARGPDALHMALTPHSRAEHQAAYDLEARMTSSAPAGSGCCSPRAVAARSAGPGGGSTATPRLDLLVPRVPRRLRRARQSRLRRSDRRRLPGVPRRARRHRRLRPHPNVLIYADPPYVGSTRSGDNYRTR